MCPELEPDRAGSRHRCRCVPLPAAACKAGDVSTRYFFVPLRFPKLRVAGSNPVSRSREPKRLRGVTRRGFFVAAARFGSVPRGCRLVSEVPRRNRHSIRSMMTDEVFHGKEENHSRTKNNHTAVQTGCRSTCVRRHAVGRNEGKDAHGDSAYSRMKPSLTSRSSTRSAIFGASS